MKIHKKTIAISILSIFTLLIGCSDAEGFGNQEKEVIKIGVTGGIPESLTDIVKEEAKKEGINLKVVKFNDWITPNRALDSGELDLNMFQTKQFLQKYVEDHKVPSVAIGTTYKGKMGIYSERYESIDEIPEGSTLGIMNDPVNIWRSLLLYENAGLIKVKPTEGLATIKDIEENPKNLKFLEVEGPLMLRTLNSIDAGIVASSNAVEQDIDPTKNAIYLEDGTEFPMVVAAREGDKENPVYKRIVELYHSEEVKEFIEEKYKDVISLTDDPFQLD